MSKIETCLEMIRNSIDGEKHAVLLKAARLAGGLVASGAIGEMEAISLLESEIANKNIDSLSAATKTINQGIAYGKAAPISGDGQPRPAVMPQPTQAVQPLPQAQKGSGEFSFFSKPIRNTIPKENLNLKRFFNAIIGTHYKKTVEHLRSLSEAEYKSQKGQKLDYITVGGTFKTRENKNLITPSGYMMLDIDGVNNIEEAESLKQSIIKQDHKWPIKLIFISPSGKGIKIVVECNNNGGDDYKARYNRIKKWYEGSFNLKLDATQDVARACFMSHDPNAWYSDSLAPIDRLKQLSPVVKTLIDRLDLIENN